MDENYDLDLTDYQALAEFRYQLRCFLAFSEQAARAMGLEPQQHQLLLALKGLSGLRKVTIGDLAERLKIQHHSAVELVNRMSERNLVQHDRDRPEMREAVTKCKVGCNPISVLSLFQPGRLFERVELV